MNPTFEKTLPHYFAVRMHAITPDTSNYVAPEHKSLSPHSQQPTNGPYPEPAESTPPPTANLPEVHFDPILPSTPWSFKWSLSFFPLPRVRNTPPTSFSLI
jgi:hypothetical protein